MPAWHASCLAMLAMRSCSRSRCSGVLLCYRLQLLSLSQVSYRRSTHSHLTSSAASTSSSALRPASEQMACRNQHRCSHRSLTYVHAGSTRGPYTCTCRHAGGTLSAARRSVLPTILLRAGLCISCPMGTFGPPQWPTSVRAGGQWLILDVASTGVTSGAIRDASRRHCEPR